jgi:predicted nucleic acid-binding Zn ribbon protein
MPHDYDDDYDDDERDVVPCPYCRAEIDAEAQQCPKCGAYISEEDAPREGKSATWVVLMALALLAVLAMALGR